MLQVIKADEVRDGEPRWYVDKDGDAAYAMERVANGRFRMHTATGRSMGIDPSHAIVDRPAPAPTPTPTPGLDLDAVEHAVLDLEHAAEVRSGVVLASNALRRKIAALIAEVRALRGKLAEVRDLIGNTEHESTCAIGPYNAEQNGADCSCTVGAIAAALEAL